MVDEGQQIAQERQAHRATIGDAGEESGDPEPNADNADSSSDRESSQDEVNDQIV